LSIFSSVLSSSASRAGLSHLMRLILGKRMATPLLWRVERCRRSKATSRTRPKSLSARTLRTARGALPRGTALLAIGDWYDLDPALDPLLGELGARFDCTALVTRDPWHDGLPLGGVVRLRGAEGGRLRAYVGRREREAYRHAVRAREMTLLTRFDRANWRTGVLREDDGAASLAAAFGLRPGEVRAR